MSFDVWLQRFSKGDVALFPRDTVDEVLRPHIVHREPGFWKLSFPDGGGGFCYIEEEGEIKGFGINRPGGTDLFNALYEILRQTPTVLYWPGGAAVADASVIPDLPPEMIEALGPIPIVHSGKEILAAIK